MYWVRYINHKQQLRYGQVVFDQAGQPLPDAPGDLDVGSQWMPQWALPVIDPQPALSVNCAEGAEAEMDGGIDVKLVDYLMAYSNADTAGEQVEISYGPAEAIKQVLAPIRPPVIWGIGLNFAKHAEETGSAIPERPVLFMKNASAIQNPEGKICIPNVAQKAEVDYECELGIVIGRDIKNARPEQVLDALAGFVVCNDVSARWWQKQGCQGQWVRGKSFDTFAPTGPVLVQPKALDMYGGVQNLKMQTTVNGELRQASHSSDMIFDVIDLIVFLSQDTTLMKGSLIMTGTPSGVAMGGDASMYLKQGDQVCVSIEGLGTLSNPVV